MLNLYSSYGAQNKKASYLDYPYSYDSRTNLKIMKEWKTANRMTGIQNLVKIMKRNVESVYAEIWDILQTCESSIDEACIPFELCIVRKFNKVFRIISECQSDIQKSCLIQIKERVDYPLFIAKMKYVTARCFIKIISTHGLMKKFKTSFIQSSSKNKTSYNSLKVRFLMSKCENILSKKSISKPKYNAFRAWYLQSILFKLSNLNLEQVKLASFYKKYALQCMITVLQERVRRVFFDLKNSNNYLSIDDTPIHQKLFVDRLNEGISSLFLKNCLEAFPELDPYQQDVAGFYKMVQAYNSLKKMHIQAKKNKSQKFKGAQYLGDLLRNKLLSIYQSSFTNINSLAIQLGKHTSDSTEIRTRAAELLFSSAAQKKMKICYEAFRKIMLEGDSEIHSVQREKYSYFFTAIQKSFERFSMAIKDKYFFMWKNNSHKNNTKDVNQFYKIGAIQIKDLLEQALKNSLNDSFNVIYHTIQNIDTSEEVIVDEEKQMLNSTITNQAVVNDKLEKRHQKLHEQWKATKRNFVLQNILMKEFSRKQNNQTVLQNFFLRWQRKVSFNNSKVQEYNQLLEILSNENNYLSTEIVQLEQIHQPDNGEYLTNSVSSKRKVELSKQIRYLEFLEFQNSNLMELLKFCEQGLDFDEMMELQQSMNRKLTRSYSI